SYAPVTGDLLSQTDPAGKTTTYSWSNGLLVASTDPNDNLTEYVYDSARRVIEQTVSDAEGLVIDRQGFGYDSAGNLASSTVGRAGPHPLTTLTSYDAVNRLVQTINPAGDISSLGYDAAGNLVSETDPRGITTTHSIDARGLEIATTEGANTLT